MKDEMRSFPSTRIDSLILRKAVIRDKRIAGEIKVKKRSTHTTMPKNRSSKFGRMSKTKQQIAGDIVADADLYQ